MKKVASMYILFFLANSLAYVLVDTFKGKLVRNDTLSEKTYVSFAVVAVLSVVSLLADWIGETKISGLRNAYRARIVAMLILLIVASVLVDMYLLLLMAYLMSELHANLLDRFLLAGLCQILPVELSRDPKKV